MIAAYLSQVFLIAFNIRMGNILQKLIIHMVMGISIFKLHYNV